MTDAGKQRGFDPHNPTNIGSQAQTIVPRWQTKLLDHPTRSIRGITLQKPTTDIVGKSA